MIILVTVYRVSHHGGKGLVEVMTAAAWDSLLTSWRFRKQTLKLGKGSAIIKILMFLQALHLPVRFHVQNLAQPPKTSHGIKCSKPGTCGRAFHIPATTKHLKMFSAVLRTDLRLSKKGRRTWVEGLLCFHTEWLMLTEMSNKMILSLFMLWRT